MEPTSAAIGIVPILVILAICWKVGFIASLKKAADMANDELGVQALEHKESVVKRAAELGSITPELLQKAQDNKAMLNSFKL